MRETELLIPAGSLDVLKTAVIYGADAGLAIKKHDGLTGIEFSVPTEGDAYDSNK